MNLVRLSDEGARVDLGRYAVDSLDQETSQSLISLSQTQEPGLGTAMSSQGLISHSDGYSFRSLGEIPETGDIVEVHIRQTRKGRRGCPVTKCGRVTGN